MKGLFSIPPPIPPLGVEVELQIIDPTTGAAVNRAQDVFKALNNDFFYKTELFQSIVEITTDVCADMAEVEKDLGGKLKNAKGPQWPGAVCDWCRGPPFHHMARFRNFARPSLPKTGG